MARASRVRSGRESGPGGGEGESRLFLPGHPRPATLTSTHHPHQPPLRVTMPAPEQAAGCGRRLLHPRWHHRRRRRRHRPLHNCLPSRPPAPAGADEMPGRGGGPDQPARLQHLPKAVRWRRRWRRRERRGAGRRLRLRRQCKPPPGRQPGGWRSAPPRRCRRLPPPEHRQTGPAHCRWRVGSRGRRGRRRPGSGRRTEGVEAAAGGRAARGTFVTGGAGGGGVGAVCVCVHVCGCVCV